MSESNLYSNLYPPLNTSNQDVKSVNSYDDTASSVDSTYQYEGWLSKKGEKGLIQVWKRRFFVADIKAINYYTDAQKQNYRGTILWDHIAQIQYTASAVWSDNRYFQLGTNRGRIYYLFADNEEDSKKWIEQLQILQKGFETKKIELKQKQEREVEREKEKELEMEREKQKRETLERENEMYSNYSNINHNNSNNNNTHNHFNGGNNANPYKDFLNYINPPTFNHFDSIGQPLVEQNNIDTLHIPPRPAGPLRTIQDVSLIIPSEGKDLEIYYQSITHFCNLFLQSTSPDSHLLSLYLILSTLDWDNKKTQPLPYPCTPPYESDIVFPYFIYSLHLVRTEIINKWKEGGTLLTQIDNFTKKNRKNYLLILENEDRETFLNRNILLLHYALGNLIVGKRLVNIEDSINVLIDRFLENYESLPSFKYGTFLWKEIENADKTLILLDQDKPMLNNFTHSYLLYQKLHLENKNNSKMKLNPLVTQKYETTSHFFSQALHQLPNMSTFTGHIQRTIVKIFYLWNKDLPLCESTSTLDVSIYRNYKVFARIYSKIDPSMFPQLSNSIKDTKDTLLSMIDKHIGNFDVRNVDTTSIDSIFTFLNK